MALETRSSGKLYALSISEAQMSRGVGLKSVGPQVASFGSRSGSGWWRSKSCWKTSVTKVGNKFERLVMRWPSDNALSFLKISRTQSRLLRRQCLIRTVGRSLCFQGDGRLWETEFVRKNQLKQTLRRCQTLDTHDKSAVMFVKY